MKTFSVHVVGDVLVPDYRAQEANHNRFIGRELLPPYKAKPGPHKIAIDSTIRAKEYIAELRAGHLLPADEATAKAAGVAWVPAGPPPLEPAPATASAESQGPANTESPPPAAEPAKKSKTPNSEGK